MINLLPEGRKNDIRAARTNVVLLRYNIVVVGAIALLAAFSFAFYIILHTNQVKALATAYDNTQKSASLDSVRAAAISYKNDLSYAKVIIGNSTSYTDIIVAITKLLPDGAVLDSLNLSATTIGKQSDFSCHVKSFAIAEQLKQNFQASSLFSNVYLEQLNNSPGSGLSKSYPIAVTISAKLNSDGASK